ncbi:hypothetical protein JWZ98_03390 [Methylomonas sp. EFPC1]|nr:hypothetical protein JWZ98_03390 [Methylomonas sp. EFPC1]
MDVIAEIRRRHLVEKETISSLAIAFKLSRPTIRKHLKTVETPAYQRQHQPHPMLGSFHQQLHAWLEQEADLPRKQRRTAQRLYECLQVEGYQGSYTAVQRYVKGWKKKRSPHPTIKQAFVPLAFPAGETCQFDWSHETVELGGVVQTIAEHHRRFGRDHLICDPWHYLPVLEKKPGALRHGAPFQTWDLPVAIKVVRDRILKQDQGDRAFVDLLLMAKGLGDNGLDALEVACDLTLQTGVISAAIVLNEMRRLTEAAKPKALDDTPASTPALTLEPVADCSRYDSLRSVCHVH